jgi:hypothetical protein
VIPDPRKKCNFNQVGQHVLWWDISVISISWLTRSPSPSVMLKQVALHFFDELHLQFGVVSTWCLA